MRPASTTMLSRLCLPLLLALLALPALAHIDELAQVLEPDPVVKSFEAEALRGPGKLEAYDDALARGRKAVAVRDQGSGFELDFGDLPVGMYSVWVLAKVTEEGAVVDSVDLGRLASGTRQLKPLYLQLAVNSGVDNEVETHRMRVPFSMKGQFEYIASIYFHAPHPRRYGGVLTIAPGSLVRELRVDSIELRDPLGKLNFAPIKTKRVLYNRQQIAGLRLAAAKEGTLPAPIRAQPLATAERRRRDEIIWRQSIMPLDANPAQIYGPSGRSNAYLKAILERETAKLGRPLGSWERPPIAYDEPWVIRNKALGLEYTMDDYRAGKLLPEPWPLQEDKGGIFLDKDAWDIERSFNYGFIPHAIQQRYHAIMAALGCTKQGKTKYADLPQRYLLLGDLAAAADGAFLLAAYAYHYPAYDWNLHCVVNINQPQRTFNPGNVFGRGCSYSGWSTKEIRKVVEGYDKLFPYIQGNQHLADRVGRFVPWVKTPADVVKLIDTFLVQRAAQDGVQHILYAPIVPTAAAVLGPSPTADKYLDAYVFKGGIYLRDTKSAFIDTIVNGNSRDGLNYIGSSFYVVGESIGELMQAADLLGRYVKAGGDRRFNIADPRAFPRLQAQADSLLGLHIAGGQSQGVGDVHDPQAAYRPWKHRLMGDSLDAFAKGWNWTRDPRFAWILVNRRGQGAIDDRSWASIVAAAKSQRDPLLHSQSRVTEGFGTARLEANVDAADPRLKFGTMLRFGVGSGHAHPDTLDLGVFAHGIRATSDLGGRASGRYGRPTCMTTFVHNLVQVDDNDFNDGPQNSTAQGWLTAFKPTGLAQYVAGAARADAQPQVTDYRRGVLQVIADPGSKDTPARGYVFDVFRVTGGKVHTWCFHGNPSEDFQVNADLQEATSELAAKYLVRHHKGSQREGTAPAALVATWKLRRTEGEVLGVKLANAEKKTMGKLYDPESPPKYTRVHLFGHGGDKVMVGNWYSTGARQHSFPFLYVRAEGEAGLQSVYPAIVEPYAGTPLIESAQPLDVKGEGRAAALLVRTRLGQTDVLFAAPDRVATFELANGVRASGDAAMLSRDANGLRAALLVGGLELASDKLAIKPDAAEFTRRIKSVNYRTRRVTLDAPLNGKLLGAAVFTVGNEFRHTTFQARSVKDRQIEFRRTSRSYRGAAAYIDPAGAFVQLDTKPFLADYHPSYYNGMTAANEHGKPLGRARATLGDRYWFTGWPAARKHLAKISPADLTDENGDGKVTVAMIVNSASGAKGARRFAADSETIVEVRPGEKMLDLEVTRVREDGYMLFTRQHPREYLDAMKVKHPGWPYHQQIIRNERGDKEWVVNMPGDIYQLELMRKKFSPALLPDVDRNGRAAIELHEYGPGDALTVPTHVSLERLEGMGKGVYRLEADVGLTLTARGKTVALSADGGKTWQKTNGRIDEALLGNGKVLIRLN